MQTKLFLKETVLLTKSFDAHQDWEVPIPGFFIIASKDTTKKSIAEFTSEEVKELGSVIHRVRVGMREVLDIKDVYLLQNEASKHGFHVWMFPRYSWMEKFGWSPKSIALIMEHANKHMKTDGNIKEVKDAVIRVREYLENRS
ncbi:hypothetical protein IH982_03435 [Patescibacteria group bacterium]|nr:hypothetical protein [Patescibacteria group bacterium]